MYQVFFFRTTTSLCPVKEAALQDAKMYDTKYHLIYKLKYVKWNAVGD